jgi:formylglycine-generating enzyme required for sulfatase activity
MPVSVQCPNPECNASFSITPGDVPRFRRCPQCGWDLFADVGSGRDSTLAPDPAKARTVDAAQPPPNAHDPLIDETLAGRYRILKVLGRGGMGTVYLAKDVQLGRKVAVKIPMIVDSGDTTFLKRLKREAGIAAGFQHPNICPIFDDGTHNGRPFLVLAYIDGISLSDYLKRHTKPFDLVQAVNLIRTVAKAMHKAHETGIIHRDLKPDNIMISREGRPIVMDFGLAKRIDSGEQLTSAGRAFGTPAYMPLEQFQDAGAIDHRADIYSLGVTLYRLLTGRLPYRGTVYEIMGALLKAAPLPPPSQSRPEVDPELEAICLKAMAREAADRYGSMSEFAEALRAWLKRTTGRESAELRPGSPLAESKLSETDPPKAPPREEPQPSGRRLVAGRWRLMALSVLGLLMLLGIVIYVVTDKGTVEITVKDPNAVVRIDGSTIRIEKVGEPIKLTLRTGSHELEVTRDDLIVKTHRFSVTRGGHESLRVEYVPPNVARKPDPAEPPEPKPPSSGSPPTPPPLSSDRARPSSDPVEPRKGFAESIGIKLKLIPAGQFQMGSSDEEKYAFEDERPKHRVRITRPFYLAAHEVTQGQYRAVMGENPSRFTGSDDLPVEQVSWNDAIAFCNKLSEREGMKPYYRSSAGEPSGGDGFRLPTEAEWEYACRAGSSTRYSFGDDMALMDEYAWVNGNAGNKPHPVGQKRPNGFGLYDMHGNVWEWCWDRYEPDYYRRSPDNDPSGPSGASERVNRGRSYFEDPGNARSALRNKSKPDNRHSMAGFRVARDQTGTR